MACATQLKSMVKAHMDNITMCCRESLKLDRQRGCSHHSCISVCKFCVSLRKEQWEVVNDWSVNDRVVVPNPATGGALASWLHGASSNGDCCLTMNAMCVVQHVRAAGGVCIADEVQTGFGRTGTKFWGFENQGVIPDIVTMAKGIGNGLPLAAVVTTDEIAKTMSQRLHFNTFGGNPVCSAGGRAVLRAIEEDGLQANSLKVSSLSSLPYTSINKIK